MKEFRVINSNVFPMNGTDERFYHLATVQSGLREYICMIDSATQQCYIEEVTGGHLSFIEDDSLALALAKFCDEKHLTDITQVIDKNRAVIRKHDT